MKLKPRFVILVIAVLVIIGIGLVIGIRFASQKPETADDHGYAYEVTDEEEQRIQNEITDAIVNKPTATDFTVYDGDGNAVKLSDYFGTPIVVNFWASWCPPCKSEMKYFENVYSQYGDTVKFMMVDLNGGNGDSIEDAKQYVSSNGYTFPVYFDTDSVAAIAYGVQAVPTSLFINKAGEVSESHVGALTEAMLKAYVKKINK